MLEPKKVKYRKLQKGRRRGTAHRGSTLAFGDFGLKAIGRGWMSAREIEAARVLLHACRCGEGLAGGEPIRCSTRLSFLDVKATMRTLPEDPFPAKPGGFVSAGCVLPIARAG